uniref:Uncharacterized protein n=1 Tax=Arundo donax TaxID=35708 RepID=A0A0A9A7F8_ARUDO
MDFNAGNNTRHCILVPVYYI